MDKVEAQIRGKPPDERRQIRQTHAVPRLDSLRRWFEATLLTLSGKPDTSKAIQYALNRWAALVYYRSDGRVEIDNLPAERALRGVAIGRRNYLLAGADSDGERAATMYSLIGSAHLNGIDPEAYLHHVIDRIADHPITALTNCCHGTSCRNCRPLLGSLNRTSPAVNSYRHRTNRTLTRAQSVKQGQSQPDHSHESNSSMLNTGSIALCRCYWRELGARTVRNFRLPKS